MPEILPLIINKEYAASLIEHLQKEQAIEIVDEAAADIPDWQKEAVVKTLQEVSQHPERLQPWDIVKQKYKRP